MLGKFRVSKHFGSGHLRFTALVYVVVFISPRN